MINSYKDFYLNSSEKNSYDECRFTKDRLTFAKKWLKNNEFVLNKKLDIENPKNIADRIANYKLEDIKNPNSKEALRKRKFADKIAVYDELKNLCIEEIQIPYVYKKYTKTLEKNVLEELDKIGGEFIIKTNHGSGWNIKYVSNVTNKDFVIKKVNEWLKTNYAYISGCEEQYRWIKPGILIQQILVENILDWSFWCENGEIEAIGLTRKAGKNWEEYISFADKEGNGLNWYIGMEPQCYNLNKKQKEIINKMIPYVEILAKDFKFVRVDLYYCNDKIYFGETTFSPCSGILEIGYR